jgi:hypothetical protein
VHRTINRLHRLCLSAGSRQEAWSRPIFNTTMIVVEARAANTGLARG